MNRCRQQGLTQLGWVQDPLDACITYQLKKKTMILSCRWALTQMGGFKIYWMRE